jgi:hypothetical protein
MIQLLCFVKMYELILYVTNPRIVCDELSYLWRSYKKNFLCLFLVSVSVCVEKFSKVLNYLFWSLVVFVF